MWYKNLNVDVKPSIFSVNLAVTVTPLSQRSPDNYSLSLVWVMCLLVRRDRNCAWRQVEERKEATLLLGWRRAGSRWRAQLM